MGCFTASITLRWIHFRYTLNTPNNTQKENQALSYKATCSLSVYRDVYRLCIENVSKTRFATLLKAP